MNLKNYHQFQNGCASVNEVNGLEMQEYLTTAHAKTEVGVYSLRPLEDQKPFLDRTIFRSNMIIAPVDQ